MSILSFYIAKTSTTISYIVNNISIDLSQQFKVWENRQQQVIATYSTVYLPFWHKWHFSHQQSKGVILHYWKCTYTNTNTHFWSLRIWRLQQQWQCYCFGLWSQESVNLWENGFDSRPVSTPQSATKEQLPEKPHYKVKREASGYNDLFKKP